MQLPLELLVNTIEDDPLATIVIDFLPEDLVLSESLIEFQQTLIQPVFQHFDLSLYELTIYCRGIDSTQTPLLLDDQLLILEYLLVNLFDSFPFVFNFFDINFALFA